MTPDQIADALFAYLDIPKNITESHKAASRFVNNKNPQASSSSVIIRMLSHDAGDIVLEAAARKRKLTKSLVREILGGETDSVLYVNKMQPQYVANLAFQARQAKKRLGWKSVWVYNGNICIKTTDQSPVITISLLSQLESISK